VSIKATRMTAAFGPGDTVRLWVQVVWRGEQPVKVGLEHFLYPDTSFWEKSISLTRTRDSSLAWTLSSANPSPIAIPRRPTLLISSALRLESPTSSVRAQIWRRRRCCISTSRWRLASREWCRWIGNG
jgi:hypothetical protein